jgi:KDO2-lipid IV(A) lauroyltransferase
MAKSPAATHRSKGQIIKEGLASRAVRLAALIPLSVLQRLGWSLGHLFVLWPNKQRRNALINIRLCQPSLTPEEQVTLRDRTLREFGRTYLEIAYLWLRPVEEVLSLVTEVRGGELLDRSAGNGAGRGVIVLSPHLGAWELAGLYLAAQGPTTIFYKPQRLLDGLIREARGRSGATLAPTSPRGVRLLVQALERGEYAGILPDQEPKGESGSVFAPFFGVPAFTMLLVSRLARRTGARVIFMFAQRLAPGRGFCMHCIAAPDGVDSDDDLIAATALNRGVEQCVAICPEQYVWPYKRFRRRPEGPPSPYHGPL